MIGMFNLALTAVQVITNVVLVYYLFTGKLVLKK